MLSNLAALSWRNIRSRRARSWLTILGIMIGVIAVVTLIAVGTGAERAVLRQFKDIGLDIVLLTPTTGLRIMQIDAPTGSGFSSDGIDFGSLRRSVPEITDIGQIASRVVPISAGSTKGFMRVLAPSSEFMSRFPTLLGGLELLEGRRPDPGEDRALLLGAVAAQQARMTVGGSVEIAGTPFRVVGILAPSNRLQDAIAGTEVPAEAAEIIGALRLVDNGVVIPLETATDLWPELVRFPMVAMRVRTGVSITETMGRINAALREQGAAMTPISTQALADNVQRTLGMVRIILASIAAISLLVGAIGMMNTMYTAVLERTCEIGILKSIGAKDRHVLTVFLIDSGLMGAVGGVAGTVVGMVVSVAGTSAFGQVLGVTTFTPSFPSWLVAGATGGSFLLGAVAGAWPAWNASQLDPVRALRA